MSGVVKNQRQCLRCRCAGCSLQPIANIVNSDAQGNFMIASVKPGRYSITVTYVGFTDFTGSVTVVAGQTAHLDATLKVASRNDEVISLQMNVLVAGRQEAINRTRAAENILQVLPAEVITLTAKCQHRRCLGAHAIGHYRTRRGRRQTGTDPWH